MILSMESFPEGDFFWISALLHVLPGLQDQTHVTKEKNRYPSFFIVKTETMSSMTPRTIDANRIARQLYQERSKYYALWRERGHAAFLDACRATCGDDCDERVRTFTPTRTFSSTLRPFACKDQQQSAAGDECGKELVLDVQSYHDVCLERCAVTCPQRGELFGTFDGGVLAV